MLYTHVTLGQVVIARVAEPAGRVNERGTERGEEKKFTVGREPGNRSARWKFSRRHDSINNNRNTGQNDRSNNIVVENAGGSLRAHAHRVSKRRPRFDGGATTVLVDSIRHAARPLSPRHFCRCLLPPTTPQNPPILHRTRCKRSPAYNRRRRSRRCFCHPPPTRHRSLRYRLAQLSLVRTRHSHSDIRTVLRTFVFLFSFVSFFYFVA